MVREAVVNVPGGSLPRRTYLALITRSANAPRLALGRGPSSIRASGTVGVVGVLGRLKSGPTRGSRLKTLSRRVALDALVRTA